MRRDVREVTMPGGDTRARALVVVDVQVDFCEGGSLAVPGGAAVATRVGEWIRAQRGSYGQVVLTKDWHIDPGEHCSDEPDFVDSWPVHCRAESPGAELHPNLAGLISLDSSIDEVFFKGQYSAAYSGFEGHTAEGEALAHWLRSKGIESVDCVGIATRGCVKATAVSSVENGFETRVLADLCADRGPAEVTNAVYDALREAGVTVVSSEATSQGLES